MSESGRPGGPFFSVDVLLLLAGLVCLVGGMISLPGPLDAVPLVRIGSYGFLMGTSTAVVGHGLRQFTGSSLGNGRTTDQDTGWLIGKLENVLVLSFVFQGAYTGLSVIFAAKSFIRRDDTSSENTTYYLAGTLLNFTYSLVVGLAFPV